MASRSRLALLSLGTVATLNLFSWGLVGRDRILLESPRFFDAACPVGNLDTLRVHARYLEDADTPAISSFGDFSRSARHAFLDSLARLSESQIEYRRDTVAVFPSTPDDVHLGVWIDRRFPLYADMIVGEAALGYASTYSQRWVWVFNWWPVGFPRGACS
ncbi:hypothetical protein [Rubrivirga sp. IMCC45206]|uniref:hypothetical protein n=1 Tax=Rubrivirga sp. IMCC45206 TaxID=3391614 RepID=UPI00398F9193